MTRLYERVNSEVLGDNQGGIQTLDSLFDTIQEVTILLAPSLQSFNLVYFVLTDTQLIYI